MRIHFRCPCGAIINVEQELRGRAGECPTCGKIILVPGDAIEVAPLEPGAVFVSTVKEVKPDFVEEPFDMSAIPAELLAAPAPSYRPFAGPAADPPTTSLPVPLPPAAPPAHRAPAPAQLKFVSFDDAPAPPAVPPPPRSISRRGAAHAAAADGAAGTAAQAKPDAPSAAPPPPPPPKRRSSFEVMPSEGLAPHAATPKPGEHAGVEHPRSSVDAGAATPHAPSPPGADRAHATRSFATPGAPGAQHRPASTRSDTRSMVKPRPAPSRSRAAFVLVPLAVLVVGAAAVAYLVPSIRDKVLAVVSPQGSGSGGGTSADVPQPAPQPGTATTTAGGPDDTKPPKPDAHAAVTDAAAALANVEAFAARGELDLAASTADGAAARFPDSPEAPLLRAAADKARAQSTRRAMAAQFDIDVQAVTALVDANALTEALARATTALERVRTDELFSGKLQRMITQIREKLAANEATNRQADRDRARAARLAAAQEAMAAKLYDDAIRAFEEAAALGADVTANLAQARFGRRVAEADAASAAGERDRAIDLYRAALNDRPDDAVAARLAALELARRLDRAYTETEDHIASARADAARRSLVAFLSEATGEQATKGRALEKRIKALETALTLVQRAAVESQRDRWPAALATAREALAVDPGNRAATDFVARAERAIESPPRALTNTLGIALLAVPRGTLSMGSAKGSRDERPVHPVALDGFYIARCEVTNAQYEQFRPEHKARRNPECADDQCPVTDVTWDDAAAFCAWLTAKEGVAYALPTEAQWERAALGDGGAPFPWGTAPPQQGATARANHSAGARGAWKRDGFKLAAPVGSYPDAKSPCGALDMAGNVAEWCADWYAADCYAGSPPANPRGPATGTSRVVRGGSFDTPAGELRSTARSFLNPQKSLPSVGFRVARALFPQ